MQLKTARINVRLSPGEKEQLAKEAAAFGLTMASIARIKLSAELPDIAKLLLASPVRRDWQPATGEE